MTIQYSAAVGNAKLDAIEATIGTLPILKLRTGPKPANVAAAASGTVLATLNLPSDWMAAAAAFTKAKSGTWEDLAADAAGDCGHFEITASNGTTRHVQGSVTVTGGGGDMTVDNVTFAVGQAITVTGFTITGGNQ